MSIFSRKPRKTTADFCQEFYSDWMIPGVLSKTLSIDPWESFCETSRKLIGERDPSFLSVDMRLLKSELLALRLEVFGIAWNHHVAQSYGTVQSQFTKGLLIDRRQSDLWEAVREYNQATAHSIAACFDPETSAGRKSSALLNQKRMTAFSEEVEKGLDPDAIAPALNRLGSDLSWKEHRIQIYLSFELTRRLGIEVNDSARECIMASVHGFYQGASEALRKVHIIG